MAQQRHGAGALFLAVCSLMDAGCRRGSVRIRQRHAAHHAAQLAHPQMQAQAQKRLRAAGAVVFPGGGDQRAQGVQQANGFALGPCAFRRKRQARPHPRHHIHERQRAVRHGAQQVHEHQVFAQLGCEGDAPTVRLPIAFDCGAEEQLVLRLQVSLGVRVVGRIGGFREAGLRRQMALDDRTAEHVVDALAFFRNDGSGVEALAEQTGDVIAELGAVLFAANRGGGANADQARLFGTGPRHLEPILQSPDQAREIGALRAIEGVQFVHHQIAQGAGLVVPPQARIRRADQQEIQHLVVGEQDVRRAFPQRLAIRYQMLRPHRGMRQLLPLADVEAGAHLAAQRRRDVDDLGEAPRLIERQRVHRIDEDRLHAFLASVPPAVIQNRPQKALCLAGTRTRGDDCGTPATRRCGIQPLVREALVAIRREAERDFRKRLAAFRRKLRR